MELKRHKGIAMLVGYARTSTLEQKAGFEAQLEQLEAYGCERIYKEQVSSVASRQQLDTAIDHLRAGDCLTSAPMGQFRHIAERRVSGSS